MDEILQPVSNKISPAIKDTMRHVYHKCLQKIKHYAQDKKLTECYYQPPVIVLGKPLCDYNLLVKYLISKLRNQGVEAYWDPQADSLYISWADYQRKTSSLSLSRSSSGMEITMSSTNRPIPLGKDARLLLLPPSSKKGSAVWMLEYVDSQGAVDCLPVSLPKN